MINKMCMHNEVWGCAEIFPKMGTVVVLNDISRPLDEVVNEQMEC